MGNGLELASPDFVLNELKHDDLGNRLRSMGVRELELGADLMRELYLVRADLASVSVPDLAALLVARDADAILLTGDGALRVAATDSGVEVHGTLWLVRMAVESGALSGEDGGGALRTMLDNGRWLPRADTIRLAEALEQAE